MSAADPFSLAGKRVLVTGASSGIGRQIAISCAQMGAQVVVSGKTAETDADGAATLDVAPGPATITVVKEGFLKADDICTAKYKAACQKAGVE